MIYPLTDRQERILRCIREWIAEHGEAPSIREIGKQVGLSSPSSVLHQLNQLEKRGLLSRERGTSRAVSSPADSCVCAGRLRAGGAIVPGGVVGSLAGGLPAPHLSLQPMDREAQIKQRPPQPTVAALV